MANLPVGTTIYEWISDYYSPSVYTTALEPSIGNSLYNIYGEEIGSISLVEVTGYPTIYAGNENMSIPITPQDTQYYWERTEGDTTSTTVQEGAKYFSKLSNGTNTYVIKDANAVHTEDVTSTYSPTGTAPVNGTAVASALPTVNNSTITIQKNGTTVDSFTTNASSAKTINITVPTQASDISTAGTNISISGNTISTVASKVTIRRYS